MEIFVGGEYHVSLIDVFDPNQVVYKRTLTVHIGRYCLSDIAYRDTAYELLVTLHGISMTDINQ